MTNITNDIKLTKLKIDKPTTFGFCNSINKNLAKKKFVNSKNKVSLKTICFISKFKRAKYKINTIVYNKKPKIDLKLFLSLIISL
ncbi:hypothetical protein [Candidatus Pelagibacter sp.]|uniref:hypothetical protein n=1 Tax=Candidatus Pelagibacter sp. TaxID=2024849 RepID=UPI003F8489D1